MAVGGSATKGSLQQEPKTGSALSAVNGVGSASVGSRSHGIGMAGNNRGAAWGNGTSLSRVSQRTMGPGGAADKSNMQIAVNQTGGGALVSMGTEPRQSEAPPRILPSQGSQQQAVQASLNAPTLT